MTSDHIGSDDAEMFELAPVSLWLEDYSGLKRLLDGWRMAGVTDLRNYLNGDMQRVQACSEQIRVLKVNRKTLTLFEADSLADLTANLGRVFRDDMLHTLVEELVQLWDGYTEFFNTSANYSLSGRRIDIQMTGRVLPGYEQGWERVLVAIEDVTERETARRRQAASEQYALGLFEHSPVSLWVEDFSAIKSLLDGVREQGIIDFRIFTDVHPEFVQRCMSEIRVLDVNRQTLDMFAAPSKQALLHRLGEVFRDNMQLQFREQLIDLWNGKLFQQREVVNYTLDGSEVHALMQFSVLPGHENDWSLVQVALTDITARKKAEAYLEYLGKHDVLTKLYNRSFYVDELNRIERNGFRPVSVVMLDLNGLKSANDALGHAIGDALLRRVGEVLNKAVERPCHAARIGGDEFALLLPAVDEKGAEAMMENVAKLVELNNQFYPGVPLCLSMGAATARHGEKLEDVIKRADLRMLRAKRAHYAEAEASRVAAQDGSRKAG